MQESIYTAIYEIVKQIPEGRITTYGTIAKMIQRCTPRMVGYALASTPEELQIPWHRVINSQGKISIRANGDSDPIQKQLLLSEGIHLNTSGKIDLNRYLWP